MVNALMSDKKELPYSKTKIYDSEIVLRKAEISEELKEKVAAKIQRIIPEYPRTDAQAVLLPFSH